MTGFIYRLEDVLLKKKEDCKLEEEKKQLKIEGEIKKKVAEEENKIKL